MILFIIKIITGGSRGHVPTVFPVITILDPPTISANDYYDLSCDFGYDYHACHVTLGIIIMLVM